jgi:uncharacterized MAPEG superfamily protein
MPLVHLVIGLALLELFLFMMAVARARARYGVEPPATTGHEIFERYFRVQMNTLEQLILFVPAILIFATYVHAQVAAALGMLFIIGRYLYFVGYVKEPAKRSAGFLLAALPTMFLLIGGVLGAARAAFLGR